MSKTLDTLAADCAARIPPAPRSFQDDRPVLGDPLDALLTAIRDSHERFAFDRDGRPGAIAAVRHALPAMEADLLDAVLEDVACELAAYQEALYRIAAVRGDASRG
jgi:hypothetical protein